MSDKFCLKWNDFQSNVIKSFRNLRNENEFYDVTLVSDDKVQLAAHKVVLSACSEYFKSILNQNKHSHPMLCLQGLSSQEMNHVLDYIYNGEVEVCQDNLDRFLQVANRFQLEGLIGNEDAPDLSKTEEIILEDDELLVEPKTKKLSEIKFKRDTQSSNNILSVNGSGMADGAEIDQKIKEMLQRQEDGYLCKTCGKMSSKKSNAYEHAETHIDGLSVPCHICEKSFRSRLCRRKHMSRVHRCSN